MLRKNASGFQIPFICCCNTALQATEDISETICIGASGTGCANAATCVHCSLIVLNDLEAVFVHLITVI